MSPFFTETGIKFPILIVSSAQSKKVREVNFQSKVLCNGSDNSGTKSADKQNRYCRQTLWREFDFSCSRNIAAAYGWSPITELQIQSWTLLEKLQSYTRPIFCPQCYFQVSV